MKKVLIIDPNQGFTADIERNLVINELDDIEIIVKNNIDSALLDFESIKPSEVVIPVSLIGNTDWNLGVPVYSFAKTNEEIMESHNKSIKCFGVIKRASDLLSAIESGTTIHIKKDEKVENKEPMEVSSSKKESTNTDNVEKKVEVKDSEVTQNTQILINGGQMPPYPYYPYPQNPTEMQEAMQNGQMPPYGFPPYMFPNPTEMQEAMQNGQMMPYMYPPYMYMQQQMTASPEVQQGTQTQYPKAEGYGYVGTSTSSGNAVIKEEKNENTQDNKTEQSTQEKNVMSPAAIRAKALNRKVQSQAQTKNVEMDLAMEEFEKDMGITKKKARCVTVYSAKGGVGKTAISCDLATFLALTSHGRGKMKVCIADFNIDFGDVLNTLSFDAAGANMTTWAEDIRERIKGGENPEDIKYPEARIMTWLQKNEKDGLYALLAPITNADSMDIDEKEIDVMLTNLIENCGFDFVICDTGNNTRDSSFIALEKADDVLLVLTQNVNTANCNNSFLTTANRVNFDMNKIKLVLNQVQPEKSVGVSTDELEAAFRNPHTNKPYPCITRIKANNDVKSYNNLGEPLSYNSSHEFTRSIGEIVQYLTGGQTVLKKPEKKKSWFSFKK